MGEFLKISRAVKDKLIAVLVFVMFAFCSNELFDALSYGYMFDARRGHPPATLYYSMDRAGFEQLSTFYALLLCVALFVIIRGLLRVLKGQLFILKNPD